MIAYTKEIIYDCFKYLNVCKASKANSPYKCFNSQTRKMAIANAEIFINYRSKKISLRAIREIGPTEEILWNYGKDYPYPKHD